MENESNAWSFRDIFLSLGLAMDPVLLGIGYLGLATAGFAYGIFFFLGSATGEQGAQGTFSVFGGVAFTLIWIVTSGILARVVVIRALEDRRPSPAEVMAYLRGRARALLTIPLCFAAIVLGALGALGTLELLGRIPGIGPLFFGLAFTAAFLLSLVAVMAFILHTVGGLLYPAMLAVREEGPLTIVGELLALTRRKGAQLLIYSVAILAAAGLTATILLLLVSLALGVTASSASTLMGDQFDSILAGLPSAFRPFLELFESAIGSVPTNVDVNWHYDLAGLLVGLSLLSIFAATAAYPLVMINTAGVFAYFNLTDQPLPEHAPSVDEEEEEGPDLSGGGDDWSADTIDPADLDL